MSKKKILPYGDYIEKDTGKIWQLNRQYYCSCDCVEISNTTETLIKTLKQFKKEFIKKEC